MESVLDLIDPLLKRIASYGPSVVAFSGGVDSAVVACAAFQALGKDSVAITGVGAAVSQRDRDDALSVADQIGIDHHFLATDEIEDSQYRLNDRRRCFHCKSHLYGRLDKWAQSNGFKSVLSGTNQDDLSDYRPGLEAARQYGVRAPLADLAYGKAQVRLLAQHWNLSIHAKPASPCLASRIAYGEEVSPERLRMIEQAESLLRSFPIGDVRVRWYPGGVASIEVPKNDLSILSHASNWSSIVASLQSIGFAKVVLDPEGLRSGNMNRQLPVLPV